MDLTFTKRGGKSDDLTIIRADGTRESIACPKQGIIPHDMVHYAVESVLAARGFLSLVAQGESAAFATTGAADEEAIRMHSEKSGFPASCITETSGLLDPTSATG